MQESINSVPGSPRQVLLEPNPHPNTFFIMHRLSKSNVIGMLLPLSEKRNAHHIQSRQGISTPRMEFATTLRCVAKTQICIDRDRSCSAYVYNYEVFATQILVRQLVRVRIFPKDPTTAQSEMTAVYCRANRMRTFRSTRMQMAPAGAERQIHRRTVPHCQ